VGALCKRSVSSATALFEGSQMPVVCCSAASDGYESQHLNVGESDACYHCLLRRVEIEETHEMTCVI